MTTNIQNLSDFNVDDIKLSEPNVYGDGMKIMWVSNTNSMPIVFRLNNKIDLKTPFGIDGKFNNGPRRTLHLSIDNNENDGSVITAKVDEIERKVIKLCEHNLTSDTKLNSLLKQNDRYGNSLLRVKLDTHDVTIFEGDQPATINSIIKKTSGIKAICQLKCVWINKDSTSFGITLEAKSLLINNNNR